jgi:hypothetical protein
MGVATFEGIVEDGQIRLNPNVHLPERTKVYVVVPDFEGKPVVHIFSPRLANPEQTGDFKKEVVEAFPNASL